MKVHIIGGGPSGVALSYFLSQNNIHSVIYESTDRVGGMAKTLNWLDCKIDTGPHIFHTPDPSIRDLWTRIAPDLLEEGSYYSANILDDHSFHPYPVSHESLKLLPNYHAIKEELSKLDPALCSTAKTFEDFVQFRLGKTLASLFFKGYPEKVWGIKTDEMLANWAPQRISLRDNISPFYLNEFSAVGTSGSGPVIERFASKCGIFLDLRLLTPIVQIKLSSNTQSIISLVTPREEVTIHDTDIVVSTIPINQILTLLGHSCELKFRGIHTTYVRLDCPSFLPPKYHWVYVPDSSYTFNRITEASKLASNVCPNKNQSLISIETVLPGGFQETTYLNRVKNLVLDQIHKFASEVNLNYSYIDSTSHYEGYVYPVQDLSATVELSKCRSILEGVKNLSSIGCGGDFHYGDMQIFFAKSSDLASDIANINSSIIFKSSLPSSPLSISVNNDKPARVQLIAEIGLNHSGNLALAESMILSAIQSGADHVKFQLYTLSSRYSQYSREARYAEKAGDEELTLSEQFARSHLSYQDCDRLLAFAKNNSISLFFTVFDLNSLDYIISRDVDIVKTASMDLNNILLHRAISRSSIHTVIISTGMSTIDEVKEALDCYKHSPQKIILMQCSSSYPLADCDVNLNVLKSFANISSANVCLGYSDHTNGFLASVMSTAYGSSWIEKHFTIDQRLPGPDNHFSMMPADFLALREYLDRAALMAGSPYKQVLPIELSTYRAQKKSLFYAKDFFAGDIISSEYLYMSSPCIGLQVLPFESLSCKRLRVNVKSGQPVLVENFVI